jgi:hypothetical protein
MRAGRFRGVEVEHHRTVDRLVRPACTVRGASIDGGNTPSRPRAVSVVMSATGGINFDADVYVDGVCRWLIGVLINGVEP